MNKKDINKKYLVFIPLRKGSKRVKNKNFVKVKSKPLIYYTYKEAIKIFKSENIFISSNDKQAKIFSQKHNLQYINRPKNLCRDNSKTEDAIIHFIKERKIKTQNIVLLQATSPMRSSNDILRCIKKYEKKKLDSIFSVFKEKNFLWKQNNNQLISISFNFKNREKSQDMKYIFHENGAIFIFNSKKFLEAKNRIFKKFDYFEMKKVNSIDIDTKEDLKKFKNNLK